MINLDIWKPDINIINGEKHKLFLRTAYEYAWNYSEDNITKTGAILVREGRTINLGLFKFNLTLDKIISYGANHFPRGIEPTPEQLTDKEWKYKHIIHAEPSSIYDASRKSKSTKGVIMYMPWIPCTPCALSIIDSGINQLIGHKQMIMQTPERWQDSTNYALSLLKKAGVKLSMYDGKIGGVKNLMNNQEWEP